MKTVRLRLFIVFFLSLSIPTFLCAQFRIDPDKWEGKSFFEINAGPVFPTASFASAGASGGYANWGGGYNLSLGHYFVGSFAGYVDFGNSLFGFNDDGIKKEHNAVSADSKDFYRMVKFGLGAQYALPIEKRRSDFAINVVFRASGGLRFMKAPQEVSLGFAPEQNLYTRITFTENGYNTMGYYQGESALQFIWYDVFGINMGAYYCGGSVHKLSYVSTASTPYQGDADLVESKEMQQRFDSWGAYLGVCLLVK